mmetsp:Transcript_6077/g.13235  ORF Transcript_6077/g.13235 Transcript_6077/m.13235 type:complete len:318 (-) Transcript_6077:26-979(-)
MSPSGGNDHHEDGVRTAFNTLECELDAGFASLVGTIDSFGGHRMASEVADFVGETADTVAQKRCCWHRHWWPFLLFLGIALLPYAIHLDMELALGTEPNTKNEAVMKLDKKCMDDHADAVAEQGQVAAKEEAEHERVEVKCVAADKAEQERFEAERIKAERIEAARIEADRREVERIKAERVEAVRFEAERVEAEHIEAESIAAEAAAAEDARLERREAERIEAERIEAEHMEVEHITTEGKADKELIEAVAAEKAKQDRVAAAVSCVLHRSSALVMTLKDASVAAFEISEPLILDLSADLRATYEQVKALWQEPLD